MSDLFTQAETIWNEQRPAAAPDYHWQEHRGGAQPVSDDTLVVVRLRCRDRLDTEGQKGTPARNWRWNHSTTREPSYIGDIIEWRLA